jgi:tRNA modification GTPase
MPATLDPNDTIAAVSTAAGPAVRSIVRLSGPRAISIALDGFIPDRKQSLPERLPAVRPGRLKVDGLRPFLPALLALWPAPRTYTRQNVAEIHLVGSTPLVNLILAHCLAHGARLAEPGEFTLRAFLSGRLDLTRAEAVLGIIDARSSEQLEAALEQLAGGLSGPILGFRDRLLDLVAHLEACLDFADERDVDPLNRTLLAGELDRFGAQLAVLEQRLRERDRPETHPRVVLVGLPNAGKSRLFNALLGRDRAIVSSRAGTTRDYLTALCECDGLTVELVDTAGIEPPSGSIATHAQALGALQAARADLLLDCRSAEIEWGSALAYSHACPRLEVWTKGDLALPPSNSPGDLVPVVTSAVTGAGLDELRSAVARSIRRQDCEGELPAGTSARCRASLACARAALGSAALSLLEGRGDELVAFDLRLAIEELGKIVGAVVTDDILDRIFRRFCIGK